MPPKVSKTAEKEAKQFLAQTIVHSANISEAGIQRVVDTFEYVTYDKNFPVIQSGDISDYLYFIHKGMIRAYYIKDDKEIIDWFGEEGTFFGNIYSHRTGKPGIDTYESIEEVSLLRVRLSDMESLFHHSHEIESAARILMEEYYIRYVERVHSIKSLPSEEKYHLFMRQFSAFMNRIPLKYVASYLGITSETLSRIRARYDKRKGL